MSVATPLISSNGQKMDVTFEIMSIDVSREVNRIPSAQLVLIDGKTTQPTFPVSDNAFFEPGNPIEIKIRYEGKPNQESTIFAGVVVGQRIEADCHSSLLTVELKDEAVKLTAPRKSAVYRDQSDDKVIGDIISKRGLSPGTITTTQTKHVELVQFYCSDWDFIRTRAESNGLLTAVNDGEISCREITLNGSPKHTFKFGISEIFNFEIEADSLHQVPEVQSVAWDIKGQKLTKATKAKAFQLAQGNLDAAKIAETIGVETQTLVSAIPLTTQELQSWSDSALVRSRMAMLRGRLCIHGVGDIKLLDVIEVSGFSRRFNGRTLVTGIRHRLDHHGWQTDVQFGISPQRFSEQPDVTEVPAAGLLPAVNGLQIGIVDKFQQDPGKELRVKVILPSIHETEGGVWARLAAPDAGSSRGFFFRPEPGDEVIVGFFNDDPRQPVILGAMFSSKNTPPEGMAELSEANTTKGIVTKKGTSIRFLDDEKSSLLIQTPKKNQITLDDEAEKINITDQHGNSIVLDKNGIVITSVKDLILDAGKGNVEIKGKQVDVK